MKNWFATSAVLTAAGAVVLTRTARRRGAMLEKVFADDDFHITRLPLPMHNRLFATYPCWSDLYLNAVAEVLEDGSTRAFPNERWNGWDRKPHTAAEHFVCVQSVFADEQDALWVLDPAAPLRASPVPNGA